MERRSETRAVLKSICLAAAVSFACNSAAAKEQLDIDMKRVAPHGTAAILRFENRTKIAFCLAPLSFDTAQFNVLVKGRLVLNKTVFFDPPPPCIRVAPGAVMTRIVELSRVISADDLRKGRLCYEFSYGGVPDARRWVGGQGTICEGRRSRKYIVLSPLVRQPIDIGD